MAKVSLKSMSPEEQREYRREIAKRGGKARAKAVHPGPSKGCSQTGQQ